MTRPDEVHAIQDCPGQDCTQHNEAAWARPGFPPEANYVSWYFAVRALMNAGYTHAEAINAVVADNIALFRDDVVYPVVGARPPLDAPAPITAPPGPAGSSSPADSTRYNGGPDPAD